MLDVLWATGLGEFQFKEFKAAFPTVRFNQAHSLVCASPPPSLNTGLGEKLHSGKHIASKQIACEYLTLI